MLIRLLLIFVLAGVTEASAMAATPKIDLYTMGVGADVVEKFGHAALCTRYPQEPRRDRCYNYGTTNFADPAGLGWSFVRGRAKFWVSIAKPEQMIDLYIRRDRTVWVQELSITPAEAKAIADKLHFDSLKANRFYIYHHYFDNCTTRIRDILDAGVGGFLSKDSSGGFGATYRELSRSGFSETPGLLIASDYVLGRIGDREPTLYEAMFLPDVLRAEVENRMGVAPVIVYERHGPMPSRTPGHARLYMLICGLLLVAPIWLERRRGKLRRAAFGPAVVFMTLIGTAIWLLAVLSPLEMARYNEALLLFVPMDFVLFFLGERLRKRYCLVRLSIVLLATIAASIGILSQPLWAIAPVPVLAFLPLALGVNRRQSEG